LDCGQTDAKTGKGSRSGDHYKSADVLFGEFVAGEQCCDLRNKLRRKSAADDRHRIDHFHVVPLCGALPCPRQRDAAMLAGSIDGEKKHSAIKVIYPSKSAGICGDYFSPIRLPVPKALRL